MNADANKTSKLVGFLFLSNLLAIGFVIVVSFYRDVSVGEFGNAVVAATCMALFFLALHRWVKRRTRTVATRNSRIVASTPTQQHRLSHYLSYATLIASGVFAVLAFALGLISFDFEFGRSVIQDLASLYNWIVPLLMLFLVTMFWFNFFAFLWWMIRQDRRFADPVNQKRRAEQAEYRRKLERERAEANRIAQLNKPDFGTRLNQFVTNVQTSGTHPSPDLDEPFVSRIKFWQCEPFHERTLPKSVDFVRRILRRIAKAVHGY